MPAATLLSAIAGSFLAGEAEVEAVVARAARTLGRRWRWLRPLAERYLEATAGRPRPTHREVVRFLSEDKGFRRARRKHRGELEIADWLVGPQTMQPAEAARHWGVPAVESVGALAAWLGVSDGDLEWFADLKGLTCRRGPSGLNHYHYRILPKSSGTVRLVEAPKERLKNLQRKILAGILEKVPVHPAAHGFVPGRSILTFAAPHTARRVVLRLDLRDFFPTFAAARIQAFFRTAGYPETVAARLGAICTNAVPRVVWKGHLAGVPERLELRALYGRRHLPQGAPTSPMLANICMYGLDCRLAGLAASADARYTRYADDLVFSGDRPFESRVERFATHVAAVLSEEGFSVHHRKTRVMRQGVRQHVAGVVANAHVNIMRPDFDVLKAILTNCVRFGPEGQNREGHANFRAHLEGRVAFVAMVNRDKGLRLRQVLEQIRWP